MNAKEFKYQERCLREQNKMYGPRLEDIPEKLWPNEFIMPIAVFRSCNFLVQIYKEMHGVLRLSVTRSVLLRDGSFKDGITWDEMQEIKSQCGYGDKFAVEVYPADDEVVNVANMRHIFILKEAPAVAWRHPNKLKEEANAE